MKKVWVLIALFTVVMLAAAQGGCQKKDAPAGTATVETKKSEAKPAEAPAAEDPDMAKPKDHPAH